jgi:hypothetical protein
LFKRWLKQNEIDINKAFYAVIIKNKPLGEAASLFIVNKSTLNDRLLGKHGLKTCKLIPLSKTIDLVP